MKICHVALLVVLSAAGADAHHNFRAEFDINAPFTVTGTVTKVEWTNPHTWFYLDVKDDKGDRHQLGDGDGQPERADARGLEAHVDECR